MGDRCGKLKPQVNFHLTHVTKPEEVKQNGN